MFTTLLYPTDFSENSEKALSYIKALRNAGAKKIILVHVVHDKSKDYSKKGVDILGKSSTEVIDLINKTLRQELYEKMKPIEEDLKQNGFVVTIAIESGKPAEKILATAEKEKVSAIVIGSHGKSNVSSMLLGSVSDHVIRHAKQAVLVVKRD